MLYVATTVALERDQAALCKESEGHREYESASKRRKSGVDSQWVKDFHGLQVVDTVNGDGMFCSLCRKYSSRPKKICSRERELHGLICRVKFLLGRV